MFRCGFENIKMADHCSSPCYKLYQIQERGSNQRIDMRNKGEMNGKKIKPPDLSGHMKHRRCLKKSLLISLIISAHILNSISEGEYMMDHWEKAVMGHTISMSQATCNQYATESKKAVDVFRAWLQTHEEAQIMVGSVLIVFGLWWLARTVFALLVNLVCPLLFVLLAVICVPQLRVSLLGQNYPVLANLLRSILLKMADSLSATT